MPSNQQTKPHASTAKDAAVLHLLTPFVEYLKDDTLTEICVNRPLEIFTEGREGWKRYDVPILTYDYLLHLARAIATYSNQTIDETRAILSATLPGGQRCQVVIPPACEPGTASFTIRKPSMVDVTLEQYETQGAFSECRDSTQDLLPHEQKLLDLKAKGRYRDFIELAVKTRQNIIVSGATGSGKTTFTKAIINKIPKDERLVSIENVSELKLIRTHPNSVAMFYSAGGQGLSKASPQQLMESALRMKPDRVMLAELIRGDEAFYYMRNVNSGHPGSITTMHSNSPKLCIEQLVLFIKESSSGATMSREDIKQLLYMCIDVIVQFKFVNGRRQVTEIYYDPIFKKQHIG